MKITSWEWHPLYGLYSRLVYKEIDHDKDIWICIRREYKTL